MTNAALVIVGTGVQAGVHLSIQARESICLADKVLYVIPGDWAESWMLSLNDTAESLIPLYNQNQHRLDTYGDMVERIMHFVRQGLQVCTVFYGHPGVFVTPSHEAIALARREGFTAVMYPGISAEDCLFADLGVDPATCGCQSFEATDFLVRRRRFDPHSHLIIWQIGVVGHLGSKATQEINGLRLLTDELAKTYGLDHVAIIYEAAPHPRYQSRIERVSLKNLPKTRLISISTLYIPPKAIAPIDETQLAALGLTRADITKKW
ncbi:MAG: SAM-dependent methyltransferase [Chloroflexota bacterium]